jgi:hypothetical protein
MTNPRRPSLLWRLFVLGGVGTAGAVAFNDAAWEKWKETFGDAMPRETFKNIAVGTAGLHATEAAFALVTARSKGVEKPGRWALSTLVWGFPVLRRLRKEKKAVASGAAPMSKRSTKKAAKQAVKAATVLEVAGAGNDLSRKASKKAAKAAATLQAVEAGGKATRKTTKKAAKATATLKAVEASGKATRRATKQAAKAAKATAEKAPEAGRRAARKAAKKAGELADQLPTAA